MVYYLSTVVCSALGQVTQRGSWYQVISTPHASVLWPLPCRGDIVAIVGKGMSRGWELSTRLRRTARSLCRLRNGGLSGCLWVRTILSACAWPSTEDKLRSSNVPSTNFLRNDLDTAGSTMGTYRPSDMKRTTGWPHCASGLDDQCLFPELQAKRAFTSKSARLSALPAS